MPQGENDSFIDHPPTGTETCLALQRKPRGNRTMTDQEKNQLKEITEITEIVFNQFGQHQQPQ